MWNRILALLIVSALMQAPAFCQSGPVCFADDGFEPNDSCVTATSTSSLCQAGLTLQVGDPDYFRVQIPPQHEMVIGLVREDPQAMVQVVGTSGCSGTENLNIMTVPLRSTYVVQNTTASTLDEYVRLVMSFGSGLNCTVYDLSIRVLPITTGSCSSQVDSLDPNSCCETAAPMPNTSVPPLLSVRPGDPDWFEFILAHGGTTNIFLTSQVAGSPFNMQLFDFCGALPLETDSNFFSVTNVSGFDKQYWVEVRHTGTPQDCGEYKIRRNLRGAINPFCNGSGGFCASCPCGNAPLPGTSGGCTNSAGTNALLVGSGFVSVGADSLRLEANGVTPSSFGVLISGARRAPNNPTHPCFGFDMGLPAGLFDGLRCVVESTLRHGGRQSDLNGDIGVTNNGWGGVSGPPVGLLANGGFTAGSERHFQLVYREPPTAQCGTGLNTSNGVSATILP